MRTKLLQLVRIIAALALIGFGAVMLFDTVRSVVTRSNGNWTFLFFVVPFTLVVTGVFFASGVFLLRRHYRYFASIWVVLGAFAAFGFVIGIPDRVQELFSLKNSDWRVGLLSIASLFGGFYVARWFLYTAFRLLDRHLPRERHNPPTLVA